MELTAEGSQPMSAELFYGTISLLCQTEDGIEMLMGPGGLTGRQFSLSHSIKNYGNII